MIVTTKDDVATAIEKIGASEGLVQLGPGVHFLRRLPTWPIGAIVQGVGGYGHRGVGTEIIQAFSGSSMFRIRSCFGLRDVSLTPAKTIKAGACILLDGSKTDARPTWGEITNVKLPAYGDASRFTVGLLADGSAWQEPGSEGVRDLVIHGFYVYGATEHAIRFKRVVNASLTACAFGPGTTASGQTKAKILIEDSNSIHFATTTLWGDLEVRKSKNWSWIGGRLDSHERHGCDDWRVSPCNMISDGSMFVSGGM